jgi:Flp pilus assembly pilin Flp
VVHSGTPAGAIPPTRAGLYRRTMLVMRCIERAGRLGDERGAVATEYGLILVLVVIVTIVAITAFGVALVGLFQRGVEPF